MTCPVCGGKTAVVDTLTEVDVIYRRRKCISCGCSFTTEEVECKLDEPVHVMRYNKRKNRPVDD